MHTQNLVLQRYALAFIFASIFLAVGCKPKQDEPVVGNPAQSSSGENKATKTLRIAVVPKTTAHIFWNSVRAGAEKAASEVGNVEIIWKAPTKESDRAAQIQLVQQLVADDIDALVLAPLDSKALVIPVQEATAAGVKVVIIDSALEAQLGTDYASYVATNNTLGGQLGGEALAAA